MEALWWTLAVPAICAGVLSPAVMRARPFALDDVRGIQKLHTEPTSRLGGVIVVVAFLVVVAIGQAIGELPLAGSLRLLLAALPVIAIGTIEDATRAIRPRYRLLAAFVSAVLASAIAGGVIPRLDLPVVDGLLAHAWIVLPLTWFMVAGACNAMNLIDGAHGLAGGTGLLLFGGIALAAGWSHDAATLAKALAMMGALSGFLLWNYPKGRIFLGDAGAYFVGFMYAQLSMQLVARNPDLSAWYVIVIAAYPIVDTVFTMYRRAIVRGAKISNPDALHLHSLVFRRIALPIERRIAHAARRIQRHPLPGHADATSLTPDRSRANARVAPRLWLHTIACLVFAVAFHRSTPALLLGFAGYAVFYVCAYRRLVRFRLRRVRGTAPAAGPGQGRDAYAATDAVARVGGELSR